MHVYKDLDSVPLYHPSFYLGKEKESGIETYYYFDANDFRLIGGMHMAHDIRQFFEVSLLQALSKKEVETDMGRNRLDLLFFVKECLEYYSPEEYQLIDGERVVRVISIPTK